VPPLQGLTLFCPALLLDACACHAAHGCAGHALHGPGLPQVHSDEG